jgi:transcription elongation factor Elf1
MDNSDEFSDEESQASQKFHCTGATMDTKRSSFTVKADLSCPILICLICGRQLTNATMAAAKLK